ncbi:hypothetical protein QVD17_34149 [Tagetes erecta]|uniref:AAA+ ATPase domain-containing protein n=1 Tax=Tagetes erecta TaxID=13708 RepID=A0AAD8NEA4_TARER|nr:hypothetical protein QVD17_34149 [Tagetes erecta]
MGEVFSCLGAVVGDTLFGVAKKEISQIWNYIEHVENLKNEVDNLKHMNERIQQLVYLAKHEGKVLVIGVEDWINKADAHIYEATKFINEEAASKKTCFDSRLCVNLCKLRRYGKMATKVMSVVIQHRKYGECFETCVSYLAPIPGFSDLYQRKDLDKIDSQKSTLKKIIEAIEDEKIQIVGINGLGGVGKTTLASEVAAEMKNEFEDIVFIPVSKTIDAKMIQEKVQIAARKILNGKKVLIILDDVWEELKLSELGIPCGSDNMVNCKILLTSRSRDVCDAMNAQKNISVNPLDEKEAWILFGRVVGRSEWDDDTFKKVAVEIVHECSGLPLFVQAVGKALKNKEINIWKAALRRLQAPIDGDVTYKREGMLQLKLSYDYLEDEVAKSCFLLCSMFPEDGTISLKRLTYYGLALGMLNNPHSIQDAKDKVQLAVESLKSSFLLLPEDRFSFLILPEEEVYFKMHDLVREMALFVASKDDSKFLVLSGKCLTECPPIDSLESYKKISLMQNKLSKLPDYEIHFPHLDCFLVQNNKLSNVPDEFFGGMKELKVLDMSSNNISSLPHSLTLLTKLRTLDLSSNKSLNEISIIGDLTCLQILKLRSTAITKIPEEIGNLTKLRLLDVYYCAHLSYVTPGVLSKLTWLEELYVMLSHEEEGSCNFFAELSELKLLKILHLKLPKFHPIPKNAHFETLTEFNIAKPVDGNTGYKRSLHVSQSSFPFNLPTIKLIQASEALELSDITDLDNIMPDLYQEDFKDLKHMFLISCGNVTSLIKPRELGQSSSKTKEQLVFSQLKSISLMHMSSLEYLWDRPHQYIRFSNLARIDISHCPSLLELFPISAAQGLVNLRVFSIADCKSLVVVISAGDHETRLIKPETCIVLSVTKIYLYQLPKFESFYSGHSTIRYPSLNMIEVTDCRSMKTWSYGKSYMPKIKFDREVPINDSTNAAQHLMNGCLLYGSDARKDLISSAPAQFK